MTRSLLGLALLVVVLGALTTSLGFWQLQRAEFKRTLQDAFYDRLAGNPVPPEQAEFADFERLQLAGRYDANSFLVDNRTLNGRGGYWVVTPFETHDSRRFLVNRGWVPGSVDRSVLPTFETPADDVRTVVMVWPDSGDLLDLGAPPLPSAEQLSWPLRIQRFDVAELGALVDTEAVELRVETGQPGAFELPPLKEGFAPERHTGYAVQWFALTGVLLVGFGVYWWKSRQTDAL